jgi:general secretion pathway protein K
MRTPQQGVAIITALLIVAIVATIGVSLATHLQLDVRRTGNIIGNEQALLYTINAEDFARRILKTDRLNSQSDSLDENWALEIPPLPIAGGYITGKITDMQACFNLNNVIATGAVVAIAKERFEILTTQIGYPAGLSDALVDWLDADLNTTIPDGAEDGYYTNLDQPYRTANSAMLSASELRLVKGFEDDGLFQKIAPLVCALNATTAINVNTAPAEVLISLAKGISQSDIESVLAARTAAPFNDVTDMLKIGNLSTVITKPDGLSVGSDHFLLRTESVIGQARVTTYSVLQRQPNGESRVLLRTQGVL